MANKIKLDDFNDFYQESDSDGEYTEREKSLLKKVRNRKKSEESETEILPFDADEDFDDDDDDDDDDFNEKFENDSDIDDGADADDDIPDSRAWGKDRTDYFNTDFYDQDYSSYNVNEEKLAEEEEAEAKLIQQRMAKELSEADFTLDVFSSKATDAANESDLKSETKDKIYLQKDLSELSQRERQRLFEKDSPEFDGLVSDFTVRFAECQTVFEPILKYFKERDLTNLPIIDFIRTKNEVTLNYCANISFYLVLKAKRTSIENHPIIKRLVQMRQILMQLDDKYDEHVKPQLTKLLEHIRMGQEIVIKTDNDKSKQTIVSKLLQAAGKQFTKQNKDDTDDEDEDEDDAMEKDLDGADGDDADDNELSQGNDRREITYQMAKNKGLTPFRKKELRNPRVKQRTKYRKALIRRKGAVRTVRKETKRYGGEISGIKATTKKGIKIK